jgi:prefoldin subunit 5
MNAIWNSIRYLQRKLDEMSARLQQDRKRIEALEQKMSSPGQ